MGTHRIVLVLLALFAMTSCGVQEKWNMLKSRRQFKQANQAYANKEYPKAIDFYDATLGLDENPDPRVSTTVHFYRGSSNHLQFQPGDDSDENFEFLDKAILDYEKAMELSAANSDEFAMVGVYEQYAM